VTAERRGLAVLGPRITGFAISGFIAGLAAVAKLVA